MKTEIKIRSSLTEMDHDCLFIRSKYLLMLCFIATDRLEEKKSKFVGMVLPCVTRYIKGIQLSDEVENLKESGSECLKMPSALKHILDFLSPLVQEVSMQSSSSEMVRIFSNIYSKSSDLYLLILILRTQSINFLMLYTD